MRSEVAEPFPSSAVRPPFIEGRRERELRERGRLERELGEEVVAVVVLRMVERAVREVRLRGDQRLHAAQGGGEPGDVALGLEGPTLGEDEVLLEPIFGDEVERPGVGEVAELEEVR